MLPDGFPHDYCSNIRTEQSSYCHDCILGSDSADCGCREGATVGEWLVQEYRDGWADRWGANHGGPPCWAAFIMGIVSLLPLLIALRIACVELGRMQFRDDAAAEQHRLTEEKKEKREEEKEEERRLKV